MAKEKPEISKEALAVYMPEDVTHVENQTGN